MLLSVDDAAYSQTTKLNNALKLGSVKIDGLYLLLRQEITVCLDILHCILVLNEV